MTVKYQNIDVLIENEMLWLTQKQIAELFQTTVPNINLHLKNIFEEKELSEEATIKDFLIVRQEGNRQVERLQKHYNLVDVRTISYHLQQILDSKELNKYSVIQKIWITAPDGKRYPTMVYNLDAIIAVGYRVNLVLFKIEIIFQILTK